MRIAGAVLLGFGATLVGLFGAACFGLAGLILTGSGFEVLQYSDSDDSERGLLIGFGVMSLVAWLIGLGLSAAVCLTGPEMGRRARRIALGSIVAVSAVAVVGLVSAALLTSPPPSEYPLPEWNRASA